jgi:hypothetical protein
MVRHSRRSKKGGAELGAIQLQLDSIQEQVNELKKTSLPMSEPMMKPMMEETVKVNKTWVDDKNKKFRDGAGGRVSLAFNRIVTLLDNNITKGDTKKEWGQIKQRLLDANSTDEVQNVIDEYKVSFSSNYVAGTRRKRRHGRKRTHKRY